MSIQEVRLPESTQSKLTEFQRQVRRIKIAEGVFAAVFGLLVSWLIVFSSDRFIDTSWLVRAGILVCGSLGFGLFLPLKCHRWVWGTRSMKQVARIVSHQYPALGDQLLGVVELAGGERELGSSQRLAVAAIEQVDANVRDRDLADAVPKPRSRHWTIAAAIPVCILLLSIALVPNAAWNAVGRWLTPWRDLDRYTFAQIENLPADIVVPHGEEFDLSAQLKPSTEWSPDIGHVLLQDQQQVDAELSDEQYKFSLPPQTSAAELNVRIGDVRESIDVRPVPRPELTAMTAHVELPDYLQYSHELTQDVRGGAVTVVKGASVTFDAEVTRDLEKARVSAGTANVHGADIYTSSLTVDDSQTLQFDWTDTLGLSSREPFPVNIRAVEDTAPQVACIQDEIQQVILSTDVVTFSLSAGDDFGIRAMGLEWSGIQHPVHNPTPKGTAKVVEAGGPEERLLSSQATFCAVSDNVVPQSLKMRAWAEDYKPDRGRVYSPAFVLHVLSPEDHAVWVANQLRRWASRADDVYEQEMRLHDVNRELRRMDPNALSTPETQQRIQRQAAAERTNAQRLTQLTNQGDKLIRQAMRNEEMMVGHLETFAQALKQLRSIAGQKMPSVAELLTGAATGRKSQNAKAVNSEQPEARPSAPMAGNNRSNAQGKPKSGQKKKAGPAVPKLVDAESGFNPSHPQPEDEDEEKKKEAPAGKSKFGLPVTTLQGGPPPKPQEKKPATDAQEQVDQAVEEQADLLAEFEKVREDLQKIMDDLDNSTFVKRLKSASRRQLEVAGDLNKTLFKGFGRNTNELDERQQGQAVRISEREKEEGQTVWVIKSDLEAYFSRRKEDKFRRIAEEMQELDIVARLEALGDRVEDNKSGDAIARVEFWADTLDRWAEELVAPSNCSSCKPCKGGESLPPAIVLELMRILEGEIDLREETRGAEKARPAIELAEYEQRAAHLFETQDELHDRTLKVMDDITALPDGVRNFGQELQILSLATAAMQDAAGILSAPSTGSEAIAAETEVIELLLQAKRNNPKGGGGGGASPGGGGEGDTTTVALALHGPGADAGAHIESREVRQATGTTDNSIPTEYRDGLEAFINAVETGQ